MSAPIRSLCIATVLATAVGAVAPAAGQEMDPVSSAREAISAGDLLWSAGKVQAACRRYEVAAVVAPEWWYPAFKKAMCDLSRGRSRDGRYLLLKASASRTDLYAIHLSLARQHRQDGEPELARVQYLAAMAASKGALEPAVELADLLTEMARRGEARLLLKQAENQSPRSLPIRCRLAELSEQLNYLSDAESHLRFLARFGVDRRGNLARLAMFYLRQERADAARQVMLGIDARQSGDQPSLPPEQGPYTGEATIE